MTAAAPSRKAPRRFHATTILLALVFLVPAGYGFGRKFLELVYLVGDDDGAFAVLPVVNYLLASLGFLFLFFWAIWNGMFRHMEQPKYDMLTTEARLDREAEDERDAWKEW